jgi:hypothetical protein
MVAVKVNHFQTDLLQVRKRGGGNTNNFPFVYGCKVNLFQQRARLGDMGKDLSTVDIGKAKVLLEGCKLRTLYNPEKVKS